MKHGEKKSGLVPRGNAGVKQSMEKHANTRDTTMIRLAHLTCPQCIPLVCKVRMHESKWVLFVELTTCEFSVPLALGDGAHEVSGAKKVRLEFSDPRSIFRPFRF